jgi:hypothetical protein
MEINLMKAPSPLAVSEFKATNFQYAFSPAVHPSCDQTGGFVRDRKFVCHSKGRTQIGDVSKKAARKIFGRRKLEKTV